jgi:hypothetical protein
VPGFDFDAIVPIGLVHIDCDLYCSTKIVLDHVGRFLRPGCCVVFDEFFEFHPDGSQRDQAQEIRPGDEQKAWREFADHTGIAWDVIGCSDEESWAIQIR